jgi:hypothetical protein
MSDENSAGAAYLAALKQSAPRAAGAAAAGAAAARAPISQHIGTDGGTTSETPSSLPGDKRKSPRYGCQGSARLRELGSGVSTWATFTDISLHGCYVEAMSTFRVGAKVSLMMEVNGFRLESNGEVRVVYPNLGMGICFTTMSDPNRERLRELLRSLSRPSVILGVRPDVNSTLVPERDALSAIANPGAALQAIKNFFDERHILSREEFFRILRKSQSPTR